MQVHHGHCRLVVSNRCTRTTSNIVDDERVIDNFGADGSWPSN
jgi:hypothetical protein